MHTTNTYKPNTSDLNVSQVFADCKLLLFFGEDDKEQFGFDSVYFCARANWNPINMGMEQETVASFCHLSYMLSMFL